MSKRRGRDCGEGPAGGAGGSGREHSPGNTAAREEPPHRLSLRSGFSGAGFPPAQRCSPDFPSDHPGSFQRSPMAGSTPRDSDSAIWGDLGLRYFLKLPGQSDRQPDGDPFCSYWDCSVTAERPGLPEPEVRDSRTPSKCPTPQFSSCVTWGRQGSPGPLLSQALPLPGAGLWAEAHFPKPTTSSELLSFFPFSLPRSP